MTRKVAANLKPTLEFAINGDEWTMTSVSTFKTHVTKWKLGETFGDTTADGREVYFPFSISKLFYRLRAPSLLKTTS